MSRVDLGGHFHTATTSASFDALSHIRYVVRSYVKGQEVEVVHTAAGARRPRRDFCRNQVHA